MELGDNGPEQIQQMMARMTDMEESIRQHSVFIGELQARPA